jgi:hypothetical protein
MIYSVTFEVGDDQVVAVAIARGVAKQFATEVTVTKDDHGNSVFVERVKP